MWPGVTWWVWSTVADQLRITEYVINTLQDKRTDVLIRSISHSYDHHGAGISGFSCLWLWLIPKYTKVLINHCTTHLPHCVQKVLRLQGQHRPFPKALPENNRIYSTIINMLRYVLFKKMCLSGKMIYSTLKRSVKKHLMMTSSDENISRVYWPLCGVFTGHRWIPRTQVNYTGLWFFLWSAPAYTVE